MLEKNIGEVITEAREKANLSQRQLAKLAKNGDKESLKKILLKKHKKTKYNKKYTHILHRCFLGIPNISDFILIIQYFRFNFL